MVTHDQGWFRAYLDYVQREMGLIRGQLANNHKVVQVHLGGGSPGYIHNRNKCRLISVRKSCAPLHRSLAGVKNASVSCCPCALQLNLTPDTTKLEPS